MRLAPIALVLVLLACTPAAPRADAQRRPEVFEHLEIRTAGAPDDAELPLIVALHGRGDRPEHFAPLFDDFPVPARVVILRPPHPFGGGLAWFRTERDAEGSSARIARELTRHAERVVATTAAIRRARPTRGAPIVMGFSQGAMLTYAIATRYPDAFSAAFPVSGLLFPELLEGAPSRLPPIRALHGRSDPLVAIEDDRRGVAQLRAHGADVELRELDAPHTITSEMRRELWTAMVRALDR
jgi:phospholipase/carboxylesterase